MQQKKGKKRTALIAALAVLLVGLGVFGTVAWLTSSSSIDNTFTVGTINPPKDDNDDKKPDNTPDEVVDDEDPNLEGNIYENFENGAKVTPGSTVTKTPYVVLGPESEDAYVYVYVDNQTLKNYDESKAAYFTLGAGWKAVDGYAQKYTGAGSSDRTYTGGLFVYMGDNSTDPEILKGSVLDSAGSPINSWTPMVFQDVTFPGAIEVDGTDSDFAETPTMTVSCYIYAADGADLTQMGNDAKTWASSIKGTD